MRVMRLLFASTLLLLLFACSGGGERQRVLTVSIPPQQWLLEQIVADRYEVQSMLPPGTNPETFEPTMNQLMALENSRAYFSAGMPGFEQQLLSRLNENFPSLKVYDTTEGIIPLKGTHASHASHAGDVDPHTWTSLKNARIMAANMLHVLKEIDPEGSEEYTANYRRLDERLKALDDSIAGVMAADKGASFLVWHPSLGYFARDYGLRQLSMEETGKELSVASLKENIDNASGAAPRVFFLQKEYDSRAAASLASELGIKSVQIALMQPDIAAQARIITKAINGK